MASSMMSPPFLGPQMRAEPRTDGATPQGGDPHLRSVVQVIGYYIQATDGEIGHVENFMLDNEDWSLQHLVEAYYPCLTRSLSVMFAGGFRIT
jgi:hypothetical protein